MPPEIKTSQKTPYESNLLLLSKNHFYFLTVAVTEAKHLKCYANILLLICIFISRFYLVKYKNREV